MAYSAVTQPRPSPRRNGGTPSSTLAVQMTRVLPAVMRQLPSAVSTKLGTRVSWRGCASPRPSMRSMPVAPLSNMLKSRAG